MKRLEEKIRAVQDWPEPGVTFRDLTPLMRDPACMRLAVHQLLRGLPVEREHLVDRGRRVAALGHRDPLEVELDLDRRLRR